MRPDHSVGIAVAGQSAENPAMERVMMTDQMNPARRRAEAAFSLLTHATTSLQRAVDDAQSDAEARAQKTARLRNARLERERNAAPAPENPKKQTGEDRKMTIKTDLSQRRGAAQEAKSIQLRAYRLAFEAAKPAREQRQKELAEIAARKEEARLVAEAEAEVQRQALEAKRAAALLVKEEKARIAAEEAAAAKLVADRKLAAKEEAQRQYQAASAARRANALSDEGVRQAERARRLAARSHL